MAEQVSANPHIGTFKQYLADELGNHVVTYQVADNADRLTILVITDPAIIIYLKESLPVLESSI